MAPASAWGIVLLTTDNFDCLVANIAVAIYRMSFGTITYPMERVFIDRNLALFSEQTFRRLVSDVGLEEILFEKTDCPLNKISLSFFEQAALRLIYALAAITHRQAVITLIARKP